MIVVADTSPINYLVIIGHIDVLENLYGRVFIPHSVVEELLRRGAPDTVRHWAQNPPAWVEILTPSASILRSVEALDPGETEAIALAEELHAELLLMEDAAGRTEATNRGLRTIGTLGILREAHRVGVLDFHDSLALLQSTRFHASAALIQAILDSL